MIKGNSNSQVIKKIYVVKSELTENLIFIIIFELLTKIFVLIKIKWKFIFYLKVLGQTEFYQGSKKYWQEIFLNF